MSLTGATKAPHNGAVVIPLVERISGVLVARDGYELAHAQPEEGVIRIGRLRRFAFGRGERQGVRVSVLTRVQVDGDGLDREEVAAELVWCGEKFDPARRNNIGGMGAYCAVPPSDTEVLAAAERCAFELRVYEREQATKVVEANVIRVVCPRCGARPKGEERVCEMCEEHFPSQLGAIVSGGPYMAETEAPLVIAWGVQSLPDGAGPGEHVLLIEEIDSYSDEPRRFAIRIGAVVDDPPAHVTTPSVRTLVRRRVTAEPRVYSSRSEARRELARRALRAVEAIQSRSGSIAVSAGLAGTNAIRSEVG